MTTPIYDFARKYAESDAIRAHMPGHKGKDFLGCEALDLTEIDGADELFEADGIIAESEANASKIFECPTFYSTEGSSLCIRAMLYLAMQNAIEAGRKPLIAASRNAHKTFLTAAALLDFNVLWIPQDNTKSYLSCCELSALKQCLDEGHQPTAVYLTSPDYLGNIADIQAFASFCHENDMLLIVDNAHGAYLKFLPESLHPIDLGADLCCDSAHKTLPVLTGGAYLHISPSADEKLRKNAKFAMSLFASTSPSYLILASLDLCNRYLTDHFRTELNRFIRNIDDLIDALESYGWNLIRNEPMKISVLPLNYGYTGLQVAKLLQKYRIYVEFADNSHLVLMVTPQNSDEDLMQIKNAFSIIQKQTPIKVNDPPIKCNSQIISPRTALFSPVVSLPVDECEGRICAEFSVSCPPAVPIVIYGERIDADAICAMKYYGINNCKVIK